MAIREATAADTAHLAEIARILRDSASRAVIHTTDDGRCAAVWFPPDQWKVPASQLVRSMPVMVRTFSTRMPRMLGGLNTIEGKHPKDPPH